MRSGGWFVSQVPQLRAYTTATMLSRSKIELQNRYWPSRHIFGNTANLHPRTRRLERRLLTRYEWSPLLMLLQVCVRHVSARRLSSSDIAQPVLREMHDAVLDPLVVVERLYVVVAVKELRVHG